LLDSGFGVSRCLDGEPVVFVFEKLRDDLTESRLVVDVEDCD